jgi:hypothetical protein
MRRIFVHCHRPSAQVGSKAQAHQMGLLLIIKPAANSQHLYRFSSLRHHTTHHVSRDCRQRLVKVAVARVVEDVGSTTAADMRHHVGRHGTQARPRHHRSCVDFAKALLNPRNQRLNAIIANVAVANTFHQAQMSGYACG